MTISLDTLTTDPSGSENGLVVRNIPSGVQTISADGYLATQEIKDLSRVTKTFIAENVVGTNSEFMLTLTPTSNFTAGSTGTSFGVTSGKKLRLQRFSATANKNRTAGGIVKLKISDSGTVTTSTLTVITLDVGGYNSTLLTSVSFPEGLELSETSQLGISYFGSDGGGWGVDVSLIGYEY